MKSGSFASYREAGAFGPQEPDDVDYKADTDLSSDPADFDGKLPHCEFCTDAVATKRTRVGGHLLCTECYGDWMMGRFDEPDPAGTAGGD